LHLYIKNCVLLCNTIVPGKATENGYYLDMKRI
jgi:hypothetical protein